MWNQRSSRTLRYLTEGSPTPKVVRLNKRKARRADEERAADRILRLIESEGWEIHSDPELLDLLAEVEVEEQIPAKLQNLIAEVVFFCWELDQEADAPDE